MVLQTALEIGFRSYTSLVQAHTHPFFQLVLPSRGALELDIAGRGGRVHGGCAAVIGAGERHAFSAAAGTNRFLVLDVSAPAWTPTSTRNLLDKLSERRYVTLTPAAHHLIGYAEQTSARSRSATRHEIRLTSFWLELLLEALSQQSWLTHDRPARSLARAKAFIDRCYDQPIKMADIARSAGLGASRLYELFQEHLRTTPRSYLAEVRLRHVLTLLANPRLSIAEIAVRTGHADQSTLTRHLRRAYGITPAAYRREIVSRAIAGGETAKSTGDEVKRGG
jgi:AraC-like DNA-binding protein